MKRKWGKAIIEVQRFVPQEYCVQCTTYDLRPITASDLGIETLSNFRMDINSKNGKYDGDAKERISYLNGNNTGTFDSRNVSIIDCTDEYSDRCWELTGSPGGERVGTFYSSGSYRQLSPVISIFKMGKTFKQSIYTGQKNQS